MGWFVPTEYQVADIMTKALSEEKFVGFAKIFWGEETIARSLEASFPFDTKRKALTYAQSSQQD